MRVRDPARPISGTRELGVATVALSLSFAATTSACKDRPGPVGHHAGTCAVEYRSLVPPGAKAPKAESCGTEMDVFREGEGFKVGLGDCTIHLGPAQADATEWKVASIAPCRTSVGPARISEGRLFELSGDYFFAFDGTTDDKKIGVTWQFTPTPKPR